MFHFFKKKNKAAVTVNANIRLDRVKPSMVLHTRNDLRKTCTVIFCDPKTLSLLVVTNCGEFDSISPRQLTQYCFRNKFSSVTEAWSFACKRHKEDRRLLTRLKCRPSPQSIAAGLGFSVPAINIVKLRSSDGSM